MPGKIKYNKKRPVNLSVFISYLFIILTNLLKQAMNELQYMKKFTIEDQFENVNAYLLKLSTKNIETCIVPGRVVVAHMHWCSNSVNKY